MRSNKGSISLVIIIAVIIIILGTASYFVFFKKDTFDPVNANLENSFSNLISENLNISKSDLDVKVTNRTGIYATGLVANKNDNASKYFYTIFTGNIWHLVAVENGTSCERLESLGFSGTGLNGCVRKHTNSKTVAEVLDSDEETDISSIIGTFDSYDPSGGIIISSGGQSITVNVSNTTANNAEVGDTVVITTTSDSSSSNITAQSVEDVGNDDDDIVEELSQEENFSNDSNSESNSDENIDEPETDPNYDEGGFNIFDLNQADLIKLKND
ncbi:hypothetical protein H6775_01265 [Candidatus Nomurabacteria bacterium]|nr:hypothetical protein [Candidatus Nomurabacteria bacterium]